MQSALSTPVCWPLYTKFFTQEKADIFCLNSRFLPISVYKTISNFRLRACMTFHFFFIESYQLLDILLIWKLRRPNSMPPNLIGSCADRKQSKLCSYVIHKTGVFVQLTKANPW